MKPSAKWIAFLLVAAAQFMVVLDASIVNVALPEIKQSLGFSDGMLSWVVTAYTLAFGGFLLLGGRMADLFGKRKILLIGIGGFTLFSLLIGLSGSPLMMIIMRALQGLMAALMSPAALSMVLSMFDSQKDRNKALGYWGSVATAGAASGLLLGGVLSQYLSWHWNFFINVPVGIAIIIGVLKYIPADRPDSKRSKNLDVPGAILVTSGLMAIVLGVSQAEALGWANLMVYVLIGGGLALLAGFVYNESRARQPLMPLSFFKVRNVVGANLMIIPFFATMMGMFYLLSLYFQNVLQYPPLLTGLSFLPFPIIAGFLSPRISGLVTRYGYKPFLIAGPLVVITALMWLARLPVDGSYLTDVLPVVILMPIGVSMSFMPLISAATSGVPKNESGLASGMVNTSQQMGGALGLAILTGIAAATTSAAGQGSAALVAGYHQAFIAASFFVLAALLVAIFVIKTPKQRARRQESSTIESLEGI